MSRRRKPLSPRTAAAGTAAGVLLFLSGLVGMAMGNVPSESDASAWPAVQILVGTVLVVRFGMGRRTPHA